MRSQVKRMKQLADLLSEKTHVSAPPKEKEKTKEKTKKGTEHLPKTPPKMEEGALWKKITEVVAEAMKKRVAKENKGSALANKMAKRFNTLSKD